MSSLSKLGIVVKQQKIMALTTTQVTQTLEHLPASPQPDQPGIRELLSQLQRGTEVEENLSNEQKTEALTQLQALAHAWHQKDLDEEQKQADSALRVLRGIVAQSPHAHSFNEMATSIIPQIAAIFDLED
jgi:hypothetical protein